MTRQKAAMKKLLVQYARFSATAPRKTEGCEML